MATKFNHGTCSSALLGARDSRNHVYIQKAARHGKIILAYLVGRSSFSLTFTYYPRIQLTHSFLLKGSGALPFPEQWSEIMINVKKSAAPPANFSFFSEGVPEEFTFWATYDDAFLEGSGSTYVTGEVKSGVSFFMYMDDWQLEQ